MNLKQYVAERLAVVKIFLRRSYEFAIGKKSDQIISPNFSLYHVFFQVIHTLCDLNWEKQVIIAPFIWSAKVSISNAFAYFSILKLAYATLK